VPNSSRAAHTLEVSFLTKKFSFKKTTMGVASIVEDKLLVFYNSLHTCSSSVRDKVGACKTGRGMTTPGARNAG
jgi:hypothetical protein